MRSEDPVCYKKLTTVGNWSLIALEKTLKACVKHAPQSYIPQRVRELGDWPTA